MSNAKMPTPRTEAMIDSCGDYEKAYHYKGRFAEFARTLERETESLRADNARLKRYEDALLAKHGGEPLALLEELDAARADNAKLREALKEEIQTLAYMVNNPSAWEDGFSQHGSDVIERSVTRLCAALSSKEA